MHSLYIHVPFCSSICHYCDFNRTIFTNDKAEAWLNVVEKEIEDTIKDDIYTIYIGGGTPTALNEKQLERLLKMVYKYSNTCVEYTIESNIESLNKEKIECLKKYNVNRISLGVQSLQDDLLKEMGRKHRRADVESKIKEIYESGIHNISVDLIYGFENQSVDTFVEDVEALSNNPHIHHISMYSLTIEEHSLFHKLGKKACSNEQEALLFEKGIEVLKKNHYIHYEVANFCKQGYESKHNMTYWRYQNFYGIGLGASGKENHLRYDKMGTVDDYINHRMHIEYIELSKEEEMFENIMMSLRMKEGLNLKTFKQRYQIDFKEYYKKEIEDCLAHNEIFFEGDYMKVSEKAMFLLHDILIKFMR